MVRSVDDYIKELYKSGEQSLIDSENVLNENALKSKDIINQQADTSVQTVTDSYNTKIADVKEGYNEAFNRNEVQKVLNERYLERKAAELGLTDSGMNRTQMTANQLSHANQQGRLDAALQKDVNTLAAAMQAQISGINTQRNADIAEVDMNLNSGISKLRSDYETSVREQAVEAHNAEYKAEQERLAAEHKAEQEAITAANKANTERINAAASSLNTLISHLSNADLDPATKESYMRSYVNQHGASSAFYDVLNQYGYSNDKAYTEVMRDYFLNSKVSREDKIKKYIETYKLYGKANDSFLRAMDNVPSKYVDGLTMQELDNVIRRVLGE